MKHFLLLAFLPFIGFGQDTLRDDFSDGNFSQNPSWKGDDSLFMVNSAMELQLDANTSGTSILSANSQISLDAKWRFSLKFSFNPSSSNYAKVYIMSDQKDLKSAVNGYFVRIGGSSLDKLSLYRQTGNTIHLLTESPIGYLNTSNVELDVLVERDSNFNWSLYADTGSVPNNLSLMGTAFDSTYFASSYFGINYKFTSTRAKLFFFDDLIIVGHPYLDLEKPKLDSIIQLYKNSVQIVFNEKVTKTSSEDLNNYIVNNGLGIPIKAEQDSFDSQKVNLTFSNEFVYNEKYSMTVDGVKDVAGNITKDSASFGFAGHLPQLAYYQFNTPNSIRLKYDKNITENNAKYIMNYLFSSNLDLDSVSVNFHNGETFYSLHFKDSIPENQNIHLRLANQQDTLGYDFKVGFWFCRRSWERNDVLINEIMSDPSPLVGIYPNQLPESEYLEIFNKSNYYLNLKDWILTVNGDSIKIEYFNLAPKAYLVLIKNENSVLFHDSISKLPIDIGSTALLNSGAELCLISKTNSKINSVNYNANWYLGTGKEDGGWSLERADVNICCNGSVNWFASENPLGGSPGFKNSVTEDIQDSIQPRVEALSLNGDSLLLIEWNKELGWADLDTSQILIEPNLEIKELILLDDKVLQMSFKEKMTSHILYKLKWLVPLKDCFGNVTFEDSISFAIPFIPTKSEVLINEVLFNPYPGSSDFVELYNNSNKVFDLSKIRIGNWNNQMAIIEDVNNLCNEPILFFPHCYLVLSEDINSVKEKYRTKDESWFVELANLPSLPDNSGSVCIINSKYEILDVMEYNEDDHSVFLNENEGVSLERLSLLPDAKGWFSASSQVGFASPGYKNSQGNYANHGKGIVVKPKLFSPNLDGYNDFLEISLNSDYSGYVVDVSIWNSVGNRVRVLEEKTLVGSSTRFIWEGDDDSRTALAGGLYIVLIEGIHHNGQTMSYKRSCVLSR